MGSCTSRPRKIVGNKRMLDLAKLHAKNVKRNSHLESNISLKIFNINDEKVPILNLEINPLRLRRIMQRLSASSS